MKIEKQRGSHGAWTPSKIKFQCFFVCFFLYYSFSFLVQHFSICTFLCLSSVSESESLDEDEDLGEEKDELKQDEEEDDGDDDCSKDGDDDDEIDEDENGLAEYKAMQKIADPTAFPSVFRTPIPPRLRKGELRSTRRRSRRRTPCRKLGGRRGRRSMRFRV